MAGKKDRQVTAQAILSLAGTWGVSMVPAQAGPLAAYLATLLKWNQRMNLVGPGDWRSVFTDLVLDSWYLADLLQELDMPAAPVCYDLGAGAGLPGIPLRIFWNPGTYNLVEIREKRLAFLRYATALLELKNTYVLEGRAEHILSARPPADLILSRAFMPWKEYLALIHGHVAPGGYALVLANDPYPPQGVAGEVSEVDGWQFHREQRYETSGGKRYFWVFTPASASR